MEYPVYDSKLLRWGSCSGDLRSVKYPLIIINPKFILGVVLVV